MKAFQVAMPLRVRVALLIGVLGLIAGAGLFAYRYYSQPTTLTVAVGTLDGEGKQIASIIASRFATTQSSIKFKVENVGTALDAAKAFAAGAADLAIVRADVGDLQQARTVAITAHGVVMIVAPPGSSVNSIAKLKGHTVGVIGGEINHGVVDALKKEYDLGNANVTFKDIAITDARRAVQAKEVSAVLLVVPLTDKYLSYVKGLFPSGNSSPVLIEIDSAGAIADNKGPYESFDIPKGTLRGAPPVPDDDTTTLRVSYYLVANRRLDPNLIAELTKKVMGVRRDLVGEQPLLSGISAAETDPDAFLTVHPGAAAYYNGTAESFMDRYSNEIYLTPMVLGALASIFAAAWRFLSVGKAEPGQTALDALCALPERIRKINLEAELASIEEEVDNILRTELARSSQRDDDDAAEVWGLTVIAQRIDNLIQHRRAMLSAAPQTAGRDG